MTALFGWLGDLMKYLLDWAFQLTGNYGWAIIILTLIIYLVTLPLNIRQITYGRKMQAIQPKLNALKKKYEGNPQKLNEETLKLMKEENVNPAAGCLPVLIQIPILFALFATLRNPETFIGDTKFFIWDVVKPDSTYVLPILAVITTYLQQRVTITDPSQRMMTIIFPLMIGYFALTFPAGVTFYWVLRNILTLVQTILLRPSTPSVAEGGSRST